MGCTMMAALLLTSFVTFSGLSSTNANAAAKTVKSPSDYTGTVTIWDWDGNLGKFMGPAFNKVYPNIKLNYVTVNYDDYMQKLQSSITAGSDVPDVILGEIGFRGKLFDFNILENLEAAPYNLKRSDLLSYVIPLLSNSKGQIVGVDEQMCPAGFAYRRDLAKKYLGTDNPDMLAKILSSWDSFIAQGKKVKQKSGGKVNMMAGIGDALLTLEGQSARNYINGTTIDVTSRYKTVLQEGIKIRDAGIVGKYELYSPAWNASFAKGDTIFYNAAPWSPQYVITTNDKNGKGRWGLMKAPGNGFTLGGTSVGIYSKSPNKEAAWEYIKFAFFSKEGSTINYKNTGALTGYKPFYGAGSPINTKGAYDDFFGGQNLAKTFLNKIAPATKGQVQTKYQSVVSAAFSKITPMIAKDTTMNYENAMKKLIDEVKLNAQDATVK